ncbi:MAG: phosphoadenosine phosphosulfate reductase [Rhodobacteraceae bacterium]|nr:MAG: phosphoadenosine phosphosulfate reductase [Paracoccaceae bacterium]
METTTPSEDQSQSAWKENLVEIGAREGFYEELGSQHSALFVKRGKTLIVTFENLDHVYENAEDRMPWGYGFVVSRNWSMLGLMAKDWTWYRDDSVFDFFDRLRKKGFFKDFDKVVFYGASMGAYAASVFSAASPGATVICISPQATLDREIASWETRYHKAWRQSFSGRYAYGPDMVEAAKNVYIFYDPRAPLDAMHAALYRGENITKYRCRFMGHRIASLWLQLGILKPVIEGCVDGTLGAVDFYKSLRARRDNKRFQKEMLHRLEGWNRPKLLADYCTAVLSRRHAPHFRNARSRALSGLAKKS